MTERRKRRPAEKATNTATSSRDRLTAALAKSAGVIDLADYPEWSTPERISDWVRELRRPDHIHRAN